MKNELNKEELRHLLGGMSNTNPLSGGTSSNITSGVNKGVEMININSVSACTNCPYENTSIVSPNENDVFGCDCRCIKY